VSNGETVVKGKITCQLCGEPIHAVQLHLAKKHPEITVEAYQARFPGAPILSPDAEIVVKKKLETEMAAKLKLVEEPAHTPAAPGERSVVVSMTAARGFETQPLHEVFGLGANAKTMNKKGQPIPVTVMTTHGAEHADLVPEKDGGYVHNIELLKTVLMGLEFNVPIYLWGHAGTGKTTCVEQVAANTRRPLLRIQHSANTEESHILGQWVIRDSQTVFEFGPLPMAMIHGWVYLADEYDFAMPSVLAVYQPVLEGKALVIKEAPAHQRVIRPHPQFRFVATGNTNGAGDDTGLYQGTLLQNAANYERFGIVEEVEYMPKDQETLIVMNQAKIIREDAAALVEFATEIRKFYMASKIGNTMSPRACINAAKIGLRRGDWRIGIAQAFSNRLGRVDKETVNGLAQRLFGGSA